MPSVRQTASSSVQPMDRLDRSSRMVCGPLCVKEVLGHYGVDTEITKLVREMQWPVLERGATFTEIARALESRHIQIAALRWTAKRPLSWPYPAVLHLAPVGGDMGHLVVLYPSSSEAALVWDTLGPVRRMNWTDVSKRMTGAVLLTSPRPISKSDMWSLHWGSNIELVLAVTDLALALAFCFTVLRQRTPCLPGRSSKEGGPS